MSFEPCATDYLRLATEINKIAGKSLHLKTRNATALEAKVSLGLSFQADELVGKGMLRCLGYTPNEIKQNHKNHDLLTLLRAAEKDLHKQQNEHWDFLLWAPTIDGDEFDRTIDVYLEEHFAAGESAYPRSYFYPDQEIFTGPVPIQAVHVMVEHLIQVLRKLVKVGK